MRDELWLKHDARSRLDPKMAYFLKCEGMAGYGVFWALIETLHYQNNHEIDLNIELAGLADQYKVDENVLKRIVDRLVTCGLFREENGVVFQAKLKREQAARSATLDARKQVMRELGRKGGLASASKRKNENLEEKQIDSPSASSGRLAGSSIDKREEREEKEEKEENIRNIPTDQNPSGSLASGSDGERPGTTPFGDYGHVKLKPEEFEKLVQNFGVVAVESKVTHLDAQIENGVKKYMAYKNHEACIKNWCTSDRASGKVPKEEPLPKGFTWVSRDQARGPDGKIYGLNFIRNMDEGLKL